MSWTFSTENRGFSLYYGGFWVKYIEKRTQKTENDKSKKSGGISKSYNILRKNYLASRPALGGLADTAAAPMTQAPMAQAKQFEKQH